MKVIDHVNQAINNYPSLFIYDTYEDSAFAVLHHCFIVLGNGIKWAYTGDPKTGGYLVHPKHRRLHDDWVRIKDKPYGKEKCELDPRAFKEKIYYFDEIDTDKSKSGIMLIAKPCDDINVVFESQLDALKKKFKVCNDKGDYIPGVHTHFYSSTGPKGGARTNPYPNFQKNYSCFWEIEPQLIQEDWLIAGLDHLKYWQAYFNDDERIKGYYRYKDHHKSLKEYILKYYKDNPEKHPNWIQDVRDGYEIQEFDGENFEVFATIKWEKELKETKDFLAETIERLENI